MASKASVPPCPRPTSGRYQPAGGAERRTRRTASKARRLSTRGSQLAACLVRPRSGTVGAPRSIALTHPTQGEDGSATNNGLTTLLVRRVRRSDPPPASAVRASQYASVPVPPNRRATARLLPTPNHNTIACRSFPESFFMLGSTRLTRSMSTSLTNIDDAR